MIALRLCAACFLCLLLVGQSSAQDCTIGAYASADPPSVFGWKQIAPRLYVPASIYIVLYAEAAIDGAAFRLNFESLVGSYPLLYQTWFEGISPDGEGFQFDSPGGHYLGFGECALGFGGASILVAELNLVLLSEPPAQLAGKSPQPFMRIFVEANADENANYPVYAGCSEYVGECATPGDPLYVYYGGRVPVRSRSWGSLKSLY